MNCIIKQNGTTIDCGGATHEQVCKTHFKMSLDKFLKFNRAVRVKIHNEQITVESYDKLTDIQCSRINSLLCKNDIYTVVSFIRGKYDTKTSFIRPIRSLW